MGHLGQGAREGAGRRRDMMLQEERGRREAEAYFMAYIRGRVRGSQTREKKPRTPPHVMKGDQARSLVPITVRITADVKPKPNVAEIQVSRNEQVVLPFNTYGKLYLGYNSTWNLCCASAYIKYRNVFSCIISIQHLFCRESRVSQS